MNIKFLPLSIISLSMFSCSSVSRPNSNPRSGILSTLQFPDIPAPRKFGLVSSNFKSWGFRRGLFRIGHLVYTGSDSFSKSYSFINDRLPIQGWILESFSKPKRSLATMLWKKTIKKGLSSLLKVEILSEGGRTQVVYDLETVSESY